MTQPENGSGTLNYTFLRNIQDLGNGYWLAEGQRGTKGSGKVWRATLIARHPFAGQPQTPGAIAVHPEFTMVGDVNPRHGYSAGEWRASFHQWAPGAYGRGDITFDSEAKAIKFLIAAGPAFMEAVK